MGEWSEYFEDFPEENSANYDERGRYCAPNSPEGYQLAQSRRIQAANQARTAELNAEIHAIIPSTRSNRQVISPNHSVKRTCLRQAAYLGR